MALLVHAGETRTVNVNDRRWGLLLVNIGTPDAPEPGAVRRYLAEFLSDRRVIDLPSISRWLLVHAIVLPFRSGRSSEAYRKIWTERGSPLLVHGQDLATALEQRLSVPVRVGMRYGRPSIASALGELRAKDCEHIVVLPLFPQYASATTGSAVDAVNRAVERSRIASSLEVVPPFFHHSGFLHAFAARARATLADDPAEKLLFSFHGLPESQIRKEDPSGEHCLVREDCCSPARAGPQNCYRAQCFATARGIAERLGLTEDRSEVTFQSRLGRTPWLRPYTDQRVRELAASGTRRLVVLCPAFVADCLETLEEIGLRTAETFRAAGGERLTLIPSLNADPLWIDGIVRILADAFPAGRVS